MNKLQFNNSTSGKDENVVILENKNNIGFNSKPQFNINPSMENKRIKIKPTLGHIDFQSMANPKKHNNSDEEQESDKEPESDEEVESDEENIDLSDNNDDDDDDNNNDENYENDNNLNMPNFSETNMEQNLNDNQSASGEEVSSEFEDDSEEDNNATDEKYNTHKEDPPKKINYFDNFPDIAPKDYRERTHIKHEIMCKLMKLEKAGYVFSRRLTMASSYDDLLFEFRRLIKQKSLDSSIKWYRKGLMFSTVGAERLCDLWNPFKIRLKGWSENTMENIHDYDDVFEELNDKYDGLGNFPPELKLLGLFFGSAFMFHLSSSLMGSFDPDIKDILRNNPDIAASLSKEAMNKMSEKMGTNNPLMNMMNASVNMVNETRTSANNRTFNVQKPPQNQTQSATNTRQEVDNILNSLENNKPVQSKNINNGVRLNI